MSSLDHIVRRERIAAQKHLYGRVSAVRAALGLPGVREADIVTASPTVRLVAQFESFGQAAREAGERIGEMMARLVQPTPAMLRRRARVRLMRAARSLDVEVSGEERRRAVPQIGDDLLTPGVARAMLAPVPEALLDPAWRVA